MNTPGRIKFSQLPALSEVDDSDEVLFRDVDGEDPAQQVGRLSIATLRAAMGGGSPDRIESPSGAAFAEATDDYLGTGFPAVVSGASGDGVSAQVFGAALPGESVGVAQMWAGEEGSPEAIFTAYYNAETGEKELQAVGAPLEIEEPTESNHAATKGYVDSAAPTKIERTFAWGRSVAEVTDDGNVELAVYRTGEADPLRRVRVLRGNTGGAISLMNRNDSGFVSTLSVSTTDPSLTYAVTGGPAGGASARGGLSFNGGRWYFTEQNGSQIPLGSPGYYALPAAVSSVKHGIHLAKEAYDTLASMPAPPELEWWEPVWTPVNNVDSVSNVECQYTRTYRAAGGSLVTLEGTITVEALGEDQCVAEAPLPVPLTGSDLIFGVAVGIGPYGVVTGVAQLDSGKVQIVFDAGGSGTYEIPFRISYRAA